ncbi:MAG: 16S rRNA (guanine(966)-N(2))-methyltransferase RsmD [Alysiella sp.]|uniref:16S rRNA (guanine(966)-N(2))-methyltransferase RsmD n=1 Tax=Alysiella sp. TaxID=1872483 RepID=UPI0026DCB604|nr:16S rRNA (guanine(966)-N(2))-methyltransferase RsmD [Alysiella sp.]MDO4434079.1 16S rRNA (guanine(966)-N(2))-methyltransferase RsmD [Alysiella sp.]
MAKHSKHRNQVRICGGFLRGRKLLFDDAPSLRPTPEMVRERLFNWLGQDLTGRVVLDVFAGSGALGFEAISRYAAKVVMCEWNMDTARCLKKMAQDLAVCHQVQIVARDGLCFLTENDESWDLVLLDPPFTWQDWDKLFVILEKKLKIGAFVYLEAGKLPELPIWLSVYRESRAGQSRQILAQYVQGAETK